MQVGSIFHLGLGQRKKFVGLSFCEFELFTASLLDQRLFLLTQVVIRHRGFIHKGGRSEAQFVLRILDGFVALNMF